MISTWVVTLVAAVTFMTSVCTSAFISGMRWGDMRRDLETVKRDVAEIKGMFTLRLKE